MKKKLLDPKIQLISSSTGYSSRFLPLLGTLLSLYENFPQILVYFGPLPPPLSPFIMDLKNFLCPFYSVILFSVKENPIKLKFNFTL